MFFFVHSKNDYIYASFVCLPVDGAVYAGPDSEVRKPPKKEGPDVNQHIELRM